IMNSNNQQAETYGVTYVKHWSEDGDAYYSDYLAQRYGITAEQIDGFIKSQGFTGLDSRASGTEFLKLQSESNIDVRMLVAFAQMESSYGTAGVAKEYSKSNLFGYGAVDNDPDQGASWDNDRAVTDFKATQYDKYSNTSLYIMDLRAAAYHSGALKPGEAVYWTAIDS
ncbi:CHAP domain-containing protein, partial [Lactococcus lactis]|nr:CHAP domain-containing protein [Lactococcus lactis]